MLYKFLIIKNKMIEVKNLQKITENEKKLILYKIIEIYSDDEELLNTIDELDWESINTIFDIIFAWSEKERNKKRIKENEKINKLIWEISMLNNKINKLIISQKEFTDESKDENRLKELENMF